MTQERVPLSPALIAWTKAFWTSNPHSLLVLERLKKDPRVDAALAAITTDATDAVIMTCVHAELLATTFGKRVAEERKTIEQMRRLRASVDEMRQSFDTFTIDGDRLDANDAALQRCIEAIAVRLLPDALGNTVIVPENAKQNALKLIADIIDAKLELAHRSLLFWGVTRKSSPTNKEAGELAAIGWIASTVEHIAGKPMRQQVAILAEAALDIRDVSLDRVRRALKNTAAATKLATALREENWRIRAQNSSPIRH